MSNTLDIKLGGGNGSPKEGAGRQPLEERRVYGTLAMAGFHLDEAISHTYPDIMLPVELEVNGEAPEAAAAAARASTAAAHQAIQSAIGGQVPEAN